MKNGFAFTLGALLCEAVVETTQQHVVVEPHGLGFRIERWDSNDSSQDHEAMEILISAMTERVRYFTVVQCHTTCGWCNLCVLAFFVAHITRRQVAIMAYRYLSYDIIVYMLSE